MAMAKILVVENDLSNAEVLEDILQEEKHEVITIRKTNSISKTIESFRPELIIMDILLDNEDGRFLCNRLKQNMNTKHIPILMITAMLESYARSIECSADYLMLKPFDYSILIAQINAMIH